MSIGSRGGLSSYYAAVEPAPGEPTLDVGDTFESEFSALHVMPIDAVDRQIRPGANLGAVVRFGNILLPGIDVNAPSGFVEDYIRDKWEKPAAIELAINNAFYQRGETTRVRVNAVQLLESHPAASEKPEIQKLGKFYIHRATWRVSITVEHNAVLTVAFLVTLVASVLLLFVVNEATEGRLLEFVEDFPKRFIRGLGAGLGQGAGEVVKGAAVPIGLVALVAAVLFFGGK